MQRSSVLGFSRDGEALHLNRFVEGLGIGTQLQRLPHNGLERVSRQKLPCNVIKSGTDMRHRLLRRGGSWSLGHEGCVGRQVMLRNTSRQGHSEAHGIRLQSAMMLSCADREGELQTRGGARCRTEGWSRSEKDDKNAMVLNTQGTERLLALPLPRHLRHA